MNIIEQVSSIIKEKEEVFIQVSDRIWELAETRFEEYQSAEVLCEVLQQEGFQVERGVGGIETAFLASFGSGAPVIAILGEFDALSGMSQRAGVCHPEALEHGGNGHGCGHNLLGVGALAAAVAVKEILKESKLAGTVRYYGCPGEEGGSGKTFMVREGLFENVDVALTWHPGSHNSVSTGSSLANYQVHYRFTGKSAHAAISPHLGRSALDAVELMNVGVNYLREHITTQARVHYAVTNTGGNSPNVVQSEAEVLYLIRAPKVQQVEEIYHRINDIAKGAAMMTGTEVAIIFDKACSNLLPNVTLNRVMHGKFEQLGVPQHSKEEQELAKEIRRTLSEADKQNDTRADVSLIGKDLASHLEPFQENEISMSGSTDVGDVSWVVPTAQCEVVCYALGTPYHSWQMVAQGRTSFSHKGMLHAGKVIALTTLELLTKPELIEEAKLEWKERHEGVAYVCPIPPDVLPSPLSKKSK
ncbi:peptidase M20 [Brevibacillus panacihumi W25]|uniref:Peptidase M20 n=1 Tax=Brevibacillus panacihumi W25 TaxID=1408254 RepID=V6MDV7_9BACL|nr:M20 family metallopeptidase [Brevibacillus panacihumi]EST53553.1 peptidase M20 [Brevibacillus panacihumi W25]